MAVPLEALPEAVQAACRELRDGLAGLLGDELVALWVYGAVTLEDRPRRLGDVDTHAIVASPVEVPTAWAIDALHEATGRAHGVEWDSWYVHQADVASPRPPPHAFRAGLVDLAWALQRAHWLAGQYVPLHGRAPAGLVPTPTWQELADALRAELAFVEQVAERGPRDAEHAAFAVWNGCRIVYSHRTQDVVVSKRAVARWALAHLPAGWHPAIAAAGRAYDASMESGDAALLWAAVPEVITAVRAELA